MLRSELENKYREYLLLKNYRPTTKKNYVKSLQYYFDFCQDNNDKYDGAIEYAKAFLIDRLSRGYSWSTVNIYYSSLLIFIEQVLNKDWDYKFIPRPRTSKKMTLILSSGQIENLINNTHNLKHKTILIILYSTGVRIGELINIGVSDVLIDRKQLKVNMGKGGKDRIIQLPDLAINRLQLYIDQYNPQEYLIEGSDKSKRYSVSSIRNIINRASIKSGIGFKVTAHSFRYAYATHHMENGTDLVTLKMQLGHKNIRTTIKYVRHCHVQDRHLNHPIEQLYLE